MSAEIGERIERQRGNERKMMKLLFLITGIAMANPMYVTTTITDHQYQTALFGGADAQTFVEAFFGYPKDEYVCCFAASPKPPNWVLEAFVELSGFTPFNPPPKDDDGPKDFHDYHQPIDCDIPGPTSSVPEPAAGALFLAGAFVLWIVRRTRH